MRTADAEGSVSQQTTSTITGGRPKGATAAAVRDVGQRHEIAMREICDLYSVAQENFKDANRRVKNGTLAMIIAEAKARNGLSEEAFANTRGTIVNRVSQKMGHRHHGRQGKPTTNACNRTVHTSGINIWNQNRRQSQFMETNTFFCIPI